MHTETEKHTSPPPSNSPETCLLLVSPPPGSNAPGAAVVTVDVCERKRAFKKGFQKNDPIRAQCGIIHTTTS